MSQSSTPWTGLAHTRLCGLPATDRVRDVVDICYGQACKTLKSKDPQVVRLNLWCNPSQSVCHSAKAVFDHPGTFIQSSCWYSFKHDATLTGSGQLQLLGWRTGAAGSVHDFSESDTRNLSGLHHRHTNSRHTVYRGSRESIDTCGGKADRDSRGAR